MSNEENLDSSVLFSPSEIETFADELFLDLSDEQLEARIGLQIQIDEVLVDVVENPPAGIPAEVYHSYTVYADKENPTALIVSGEYEDHYFRIPRPKDYSSIEHTLQDIVQERQLADELEEDWEKNRQWDERNHNDD